MQGAQRCRTATRPRRERGVGGPTASPWWRRDRFNSSSLVEFISVKGVSSKRHQSSISCFGWLMESQPRTHLSLLVSALIGRLQTLHRHTLVGWLKAPQPMVGLGVSCTQVLTGTPGQQRKKKNEHHLHRLCTTSTETM